MKVLRSDTSQKAAIVPRAARVSAAATVLRFTQRTLCHEPVA